MNSGEKELIARLRRIATDPAARGLADDAAVMGSLVLTHDMIAEGVHFLPDDPPASVGWKLVTVNLSDLAGKGAKPVAALMGVCLSSDPEWDEKFLGGVAAACETYGLPLVGGDTIALPPGAPRIFGLTAIGENHGPVPARSGASAGDQLWLVGTVGDAAAGLALLASDGKAEGPLVEAYRRPVPQLAVGRLLAPLASAMMDVSDGLLIDASRLAEASGLAIHIDLAALPLSRAFIAERGAGRSARIAAATGGDDYALLVALPADIDPLGVSLPAGTIIQRIGTLSNGTGMTLADAGGEVPLPERLGYEHRRA
ncbi:thiamine-phosphate kinase [Sphingomonas xanthus]|uniref:Thiamine-monophosphate kinase n=1 Tax=Sphingomonas xanthus TaxID=2594473 RepID=A0A516IR69_9SPHN|nr:thiamine-phosphate kinase [Sphingomonas xanthus]QDP19382.1 thiamine-phosphate kinase [Sphingomonas xanthus]